MIRFFKVVVGKIDVFGVIDNFGFGYVMFIYYEYRI